MRKIFLAVMAAVVGIVFCASVSFAQEQNVDIGIRNRNTNNNNATATGGNANQDQNQAQKQKQAQKQGQVQWSDQKTAVSGVEGNQTVTTPLQATIIAPVVGPGGAEIGKEFQLGCEVFTVDELENMANSGSFYNKRGSFFDAVMESKVKPVVRSRKAKASCNSITVLDRVPVGTKVLGTFTCTGDYGWSRDEALSKCLLVARRETNTSNVVVYQTNDIDAANSGTAVGAGTAVSTPFGDGNVGAGAVSASFGKTHSYKERVVLLTVVAYDDVSGACGSTIAPAPKGCDPSSIWSRIEDLKQRVKECVRWCMNNLGLRSELGEAYIDLYQCTGDKRYLNNAIEQFQIAERNYLKGHDIRANQVKADRLIAQDYYFWAGCINILDGSDAADRFAAEKRVEKIPQF